MPDQPSLTCDLLIRAYTMGLFPMADSRDDPDFYWIEPKMRGILELDRFHVSRSLRKVVRQRRFDVRVDTAFSQVMQGCAERSETWINVQILQAYCQMFEKGLAHSVECWQDGQLVGGLYGLALGGAFFGESMFSRQTNASKVALVHLVEILRKAGYILLDTQFITKHLSGFGAIEIPQAEYLRRLPIALRQPVQSMCWRDGFGQFDEKG